MKSPQSRINARHHRADRRTRALRSAATALLVTLCTLAALILANAALATATGLPEVLAQAEARRGM